MTNLERAFGDDLAILLVAALVLAPLYVGLRCLLTKGPRWRGAVDAVLEVAIVGSVAAIAAVTLTNSGMPGGSSIDWQPFTSDLTSASQRAQVLGNLVLFLPLLGSVTLRYVPRLPKGVLLAAAIVLPLVVEVGQLALDNGRAVTVEDWLLGAIGGAAGVVFGALAAQRLSTATR